MAEQSLLTGPKEASSSNVSIYDMGGGTFGTSLSTIENGTFEVKPTAGDSHLGSEDFNNRIADVRKQDIKRKNRGKDPAEHHPATRRLGRHCERAKRTLPSSRQATIQIDGLLDGTDLLLAFIEGLVQEVELRNSKSPVGICNCDGRHSQGQLCMMSSRFRGFFTASPHRSNYDPVVFQ